MLHASCSITARHLLNVKPVMLLWAVAAPRPGNTSFKWEYEDAVPETWQVWRTATLHGRICSVPYDRPCGCCISVIWTHMLMVAVLLTGHQRPGAKKRMQMYAQHCISRLLDNS